VVVEITMVAGVSRSLITAREDVRTVILETPLLVGTWGGVAVPVAWGAMVALRCCFLSRSCRVLLQCLWNGEWRMEKRSKRKVKSEKERATKQLDLDLE
jgi:hypothetical protein